IGYPSYGPGGPATEMSSFYFGSTFPARDAFDFVLADNIVKHALADNPNASIMTYAPERYARQYLALSELIDATNPDLTAFNRRGGKIIVLHGAGDRCVSYERTGQYFRSVESRMGVDVTHRFFRFFVAPDLGHSLSGPGADTFTIFSTLQDWVEKGRSPNGLIASKIDHSTDNVIFSRPLCDYGTFPKYRGSGETAKAS